LIFLIIKLHQDSWVSSMEESLRRKTGRVNFNQLISLCSFSVSQAYVIREHFYILLYLLNKFTVVIMLNFNNQTSLLFLWLDIVKLN
jgi:hypothetical protein